MVYPRVHSPFGRSVMGEIDLDPCSDPGHNVIAKHHFTEVDDGLTQNWFGRVFINPPYGKTGKVSNAEIWVDYLINSPDVTESISLISANMETGYSQKMLAAADAVCFPSSRIDFISPDGNAKKANTRGSAIWYRGPNVDRFLGEFSKHGAVVRL